jgi:putative NADPH-quinone reductase
MRDEIMSAISSHETQLVDLYGGRDLPRSFEQHDVEAMRWAEAVVLTYPTYWSSFPAPLSAWIEDGLDLELWRGVHRVVAVTTHGSSRLVNMLSGGIDRKIVRRGLPRLMAPGAYGRFVALYSMDAIGDDERRRFLASLPLSLGEALG